MNFINFLSNFIVFYFLLFLQPTDNVMLPGQQPPPIPVPNTAGPLPTGMYTSCNVPEYIHCIMLTHKTQQLGKITCRHFSFSCLSSLLFFALSLSLSLLPPSFSQYHLMEVEDQTFLLCPLAVSLLPPLGSPLQQGLTVAVEGMLISMTSLAVLKNSSVVVDDD